MTHRRQTLERKKKLSVGIGKYPVAASLVKKLREYVCFHIDARQHLIDSTGVSSRISNEVRLGTYSPMDESASTSEDDER